MRPVLTVVLLTALLIPVPARAHQASRGGALAGLEYGGAEVAHVELTSDPETGEVVLYVLDAEASGPVRIPQEAVELSVYLPGDPEPEALTLSPRADAASGEEPGDASVFAGRSDRLEGVAEFKVTVHSIFVAGVEVPETSFGFPEGTH